MYGGGVNCFECVFNDTSIKQLRFCFKLFHRGGMRSSSNSNRDDYEWVYFPPLATEATNQWLVFMDFVVLCFL